MPGDWKRKWKPDEGGHVPLTPSYGLGRKLMAWHARAALLTIKLVPQFGLVRGTYRDGREQRTRSRPLFSDPA
jgi:hypothetical protein